MKKLLLLFVIVGMLISAGCPKVEVESSKQPKVRQPIDYTIKAPKLPKKETPKRDWSKTKNAIALRKCFGSLISIQSTIPELKWIEYEDNSIHMGFNPIPFDVKMILGGHAFGGWQVINFGCHVYAYDASKYNSQEFGAFFAGATCRYGKTKQY